MSGNFGRMDRALSIDEGDGSGLAKNVKCRRITSDLNSWGPHLSLERERKVCRPVFTSARTPRKRKFHDLIVQ